MQAGIRMPARVWISTINRVKARINWGGCTDWNIPHDSCVCDGPPSVPEILSGCSISGVTDNLCGDETCTPGEFGYTCGKRTSIRKALRIYTTVKPCCVPYCSEAAIFQRPRLLVSPSSHGLSYSHTCCAAGARKMRDLHNLQALPYSKWNTRVLDRDHLNQRTGRNPMMGTRTTWLWPSSSIFRQYLPPSPRHARLHLPAPTPEATPEPTPEPTPESTSTLSSSAGRPFGLPILCARSHGKICAVYKMGYICA